MTTSEADEQLATAIRNHATAYQIADTDLELLDQYAVIASWQRIENDNGEHTYTAHYHNPTVPQHVAVGLFTVAVNIASTDEPGDD